MRGREVAIRELVCPAEFKQTEEVQRAAWGMADIDILPASTMIAAAHEGGLAAGAFDGERMVGFVFGFPTADPRVHHSHMLGVLPEWRGTGVAVRLKLLQRSWCLARGIERVTWTFDPLMGPNASFNIRKLGCVVRTYLPDFYGPLSGVNAGTPTDRFVAEWHLASPRVEAAVRRLEQDAGGRAGEAEGFPDAIPANEMVDGRPAAASPQPDGPRVAVLVPHDFPDLLRADPELAMRWRLHTREVFTRYFARGYAVTGFWQGVQANRYVLERRTGTAACPEEEGCP